MADDNGRALTVVDEAPPPLAVGGLAIFEPGVAKDLHERVLQYQDDMLTDQHFTFYAVYIDRQGDQSRTRRRGCASREAAEALCRRHGGGWVEAKKTAEAYEILAMPFNIDSEPAPEFDHDSFCWQHPDAKPRHMVYTRGWRVRLPNGRYVAKRGTVATCETSDRAGGQRVEHDPQRKAETRAFKRAMQALLGFGEPEPYEVLRESDAAPAAPHEAPKDEPAPTPRPETPGWSRFWAVALQDLSLTKDQVHAFFACENRQGALGEYVQRRSREADLPTIEVLERMLEELRMGPPAVDPDQAP